METSSALNHHEIESVKVTNDRHEKILDKLADTISQLTLLCQEIKSTNEAQSKRMDYMENEHRRVEDQRTKERQTIARTLDGVYKKIDDSESKNEDKIDKSMKDLSDKIDNMAETYFVKLKELSTKIDVQSSKIDKLEILKYVTFGAWLVVGALLTKFNIIGTIFSAMTLGGH